ncbi:hypothetical protein DER45DRAFT_46619 [Fusarium avenaceum]|nr:hypothetical protein DER45DRAFT_46619 [Fusarium avenaceum]
MERTPPQQQPPSPSAQSHEQSSKVRRRRRPALSCHECRRRKVKCDQKSPCAPCVRHKTECTYQSHHGSASVPVRSLRARASAHTPASSSPLGTSRDGTRVAISTASRDDVRLYREEDAALSRSVTATIAAQGLSTPDSSAPNRGNGNVKTHNTYDQDYGTNSTAVHQKQTTGENSGAPSSFEVGQDEHQQEPAQTSQEFQILLNKPRDMGRGNWAETAKELDSIIACWIEIVGKSSNTEAYDDAEVAPVVTQAGDFYTKCKSLAKIIKASRPTRGLLSSPDILIPPSRETSDIMVDLYFKSFESTHRILHEPTFMAEYREYWDHPASATDSQRLTILLVIATGSSIFEHASPEEALRNAEMVHHWIYASETWLAGPLEKDRVDLAGLQLYCLTLLARQIFSIGGDTIWMSAGSLVHRAMQIGLHRDPGKLGARPMPLLQVEIRRRLWGTILELVIQASLDSRMPPRISCDEFDTQHPSNINDDEMDESTTVLLSHDPGHFTSTSVQLALLASFSIRLRVVNAIVKPDGEVPYQDILALSSELVDSLHVNNSLVKPGQGSTPFHRNLLDYLVRRFIIPLHFSFSNRARANPVYYYSLKLSLDAATAIMSPEPDAAFARLMASGGGMFREGVRVASIATGLELLIHAQAQRLDGTLHRTSQYRQLLKQSIRDMISLSNERIHQGETNVKMHMFLSMILGQAEAIETDSPVPLQIARSARDSLESSYAVLNMRADKVALCSSDGTQYPIGGTGFDDPGSNEYLMDLDWESLLPYDNFTM